MALADVLTGAVAEPLSIRGAVGDRAAESGDVLAFAARHGVAPEVEHFPMSRVNEALDHLASGKARYRVVLDANFR